MKKSYYIYWLNKDTGEYVNLYQSKSKEEMERELKLQSYRTWKNSNMELGGNL